MIRPEGRRVVLASVSASGYQRLAKPRMVSFNLLVAVPFAAGAAIELNEPHAAFDEPPREKAVAAEDGRLFAIHAV